MVEVAIIGGGVCGASMLYALSRYRVRAVLIEKTNDVGVAATRANSAVIHAGYDPEPGTLMARYNVTGNAIIQQLAKRLDILYRPCGSLVVAFSEAERKAVEALFARGRQNGVPGLELLDAEALRAREPRLNPAAVCALWAPTAGVINPWELAVAQAEVAVQNGAEVLLDAPVTAIERTRGTTGPFFTLRTPKGPVEARFVVNAAGADSEAVAKMAGPARFSIHTSRGQYYLLDKSEGGTVRAVVFQCPTALGKGVLVAPTVHGNLIVGPNAEPAGNVHTTAEGMAEVRALALRTVPDLNFKASIRNFAGLRAQASTGDFVVGESPDVPGFFNMAGIKSPGLSSAPAIAEDMLHRLANAGLELSENPAFVDGRSVLRFNHLHPKARAGAIAQNPLYGRIVCRCETVTEGEIVDALRRPLPPRSVDAVKRRCTPGMGRCQGGFCGPRVQEIIARELGIPEQNVPQDRTGMAIVTGRTKNEDWMRDGADGFVKGVEIDG